ncbi:MAG: hypothetical protein NTU85_02285 [Candidatus Kaiserbacteria bacterium]|nr:hypothetical protein [Candidatus Kaiserbacteria bacterium]
MDAFLKQFQVSGIESPQFVQTSSTGNSQTNFETDGCGGDGCGNGCDPDPG